MVIFPLSEVIKPCIKFFIAVFFDNFSPCENSPGNSCKIGVGGSHRLSPTNQQWRRQGRHGCNDPSPSRNEKSKNKIDSKMHKNTRNFGAYPFAFFFAPNCVSLVIMRVYVLNMFCPIWLLPYMNKRGHTWSPLPSFVRPKNCLLKMQ